MGKLDYSDMTVARFPVKQLLSSLKLVLALCMVLLIVVGLFRLPGFEPPIIVPTCVVHKEADINAKYVEKDIASDAGEYFNLDQEDAKLLDYVRKHILEPPNLMPYNLYDPFGATYEPQHRIVLQLLQNKKNGFFVEAGANDGEKFSNTLVLERDFGWTGLLVEPDSKAYSRLRSKHRKSWLANTCLSTKKQLMTVPFEEARESVMSKVLGIGIQDHVVEPAFFKNATSKLCVPLYSLLAPLNLTVIDYFSLDVEGVDLQVLKTIPFDKIHIKVISIEVDRIGGDRLTELLQIMKDNGFILATMTKESYANDHIFAHKSVLSEPCAVKYCGVTVGPPID